VGPLLTTKRDREIKANGGTADGIQKKKKKHYGGNNYCHKGGKSTFEDIGIKKNQAMTIARETFLQQKASNPPVVSQTGKKSYDGEKTTHEKRRRPLAGKNADPSNCQGGRLKSWENPNAF